MRVGLYLMALCATVVATGSVHAAPRSGARPAPTSAEATAARALAEEGNRLWDQGDYKEALDRFHRAYELTGAPIVGVREAECLEELGRLAEASDLYQAVIHTPLGPNPLPVETRAVEIAKARQEALKQRIPWITLEVSGEQVEGATLYDNEEPVAPELWNVERPINPGKHVFRLEKGAREAEAEVELAEGEHRQVVLLLPGRDPAPPPPPSPAGAAPAPEPSGESGQSWSAGPADEPPGTEPCRPDHKVARYSALGVGVAGLAVGAISGGMALGKVVDLNEDCQKRKCDPERQNDVDQLNQLRNVSTAGFVVGGVAAAAWVVMTPRLFSKHQLRAARDGKTSRTTVQPWIGPTSAGATVRF